MVVRICRLVALLALAPTAAGADAPAGTWTINGNGFEGELVLDTVAGGKVSGTMYGETVNGTFDEKTKRLSLVRVRDGNPFQAYTGYLFQQVQAGAKPTMAGTFTHLEQTGPLEAGWYATFKAESPTDPPRLVPVATAPSAQLDGVGKQLKDLLAAHKIAAELHQPKGTVFSIRVPADKAQAAIEIVTKAIKDQGYDATPAEYKAVGHLVALTEDAETMKKLTALFARGKMAWYTFKLPARSPVIYMPADHAEAWREVLQQAVKEDGLKIVVYEGKK